MTSDQTHIPSLWIEGFTPEQAQLSTGGLHLLALGRSPFAGPLIMATLGHFIANGGSATLITSKPEQRQTEAAHLGWNISSALTASALNVLDIQHDWVHMLKQYGAPLLLDELETLVPDRALLVVELDLRWLGKDTASVGRFLRRWQSQLGMHDITTLVVVEYINPDLNIGVLPFNGIASLHDESEHLYWEILRWPGTETEKIHLIADGRGLLYVSNDKGLPDLDSFTPPDLHIVIATHAALEGETHIPANWMIVPDHHAARSAAADCIGATILLEGTSTFHLADLAKTVHHLRLSRGNRLKILIREREFRLRYNQSWLLLNIGANQIIQESTPFTRIPELIHYQRSARYGGDVPEDFLSAYQAATPAGEAGYLPAMRFCQHAKEIMRRAARLNLVNVLIRLTLRKGVSHLEALDALHAIRPGDIATADANSIYVFLFACRDINAEAALKRMFREPVNDLFEGQVRWQSSDGILGTLSDLYRRIERSPVPDYSRSLPDVRAWRSDAETEDIRDSVDPAHYTILPLWNPASQGDVLPFMIRSEPLKRRNTEAP
ncbi:cellulose biosynthesis protein BcsE [Burkholderiaceae bacterium DAT-1]|nr:cellulose biosynthesis protein BcsE [Burkholderiaceae bacterium DAT-1]